MTTISPQTIEANYTSALMSLYEDQKAAGLNCHEYARGPLRKAFTTKTFIGRADVNRAGFKDRHLKTLNDGYEKEELEKICFEFVAMKGPFLGDDVGKVLRTRCDFLLLHSCMLRSESSRYAELSELSSIMLPNEGSECMALVLQSHSGKTVKLRDAQDARKTHYHGALRHKSAFLCPVSALAAWFFYRWLEDLDSVNTTDPYFTRCTL